MLHMSRRSIIECAGYKMMEAEGARPREAQSIAETGGIDPLERGWISRRSPARSGEGVERAAAPGSSGIGGRLGDLRSGNGRWNLLRRRSDPTHLRYGPGRAHEFRRRGRRVCAEDTRPD